MKKFNFKGEQKSNTLWVCVRKYVVLNRVKCFSPFVESKIHWSCFNAKLQHLYVLFDWCKSLVVKFDVLIWRYLGTNFSISYIWQIQIFFNTVPLTSRGKAPSPGSMLKVIKQNCFDLSFSTKDLGPWQQWTLWRKVVVKVMLEKLRILNIVCSGPEQVGRVTPYVESVSKVYNS